MARPLQSIHGQWSSRWAFVLAATGSAVGLGNIWKFPYITGENGGGAPGNETRPGGGGKAFTSPLYLL